MAAMKNIGRSPFIIAALSGLASLTACSLYLQIALFNNSGEAITVELWHENIAVRPAQFAQFKYPGQNENWQVHIATATCDYIYQVPQEGLDKIRPEGHYSDPLPLQLEKDFDIYVLPPDAKSIVPVAALGAMQRAGFPLHPISKTCR